MENRRIYDLEQRTETFSLAVSGFCLVLKRDIINREYIIQPIRSAGSVAANDIEAKENRLWSLLYDEGLVIPNAVRDDKILKV